MNLNDLKKIKPHICFMGIPIFSTIVDDTNPEEVKLYSFSEALIKEKGFKRLEKNKFKGKFFRENVIVRFDRNNDGEIFWIEVEFENPSRFLYDELKEGLEMKYNKSKTISHKDFNGFVYYPIDVDGFVVLAGTPISRFTLSYVVETEYNVYLDYLKRKREEKFKDL